MQLAGFRLALGAAILSSFAITDIAKAAQPAGVLIKGTPPIRIIHTATVSGKAVRSTVNCYRGAGGQVNKVGKKRYFLSFSKVLKAAQADLKFARSASAKKKGKSKVELYKVLRRDSAGLCANAGQPAHSLARYRGTFGLKQAQRLVEVFALGGRPGLPDLYASIGLDAAINDLTTLRDDSAVDAFRARLTCGWRPRQEPNPDVCYRNGNINDFYIDGFATGLNWRMMFSNNPAHQKLFQFVMDERAPASYQILDEESRWMFPEYIARIDRFMVSGDYKALIGELVNDQLQHGLWLSGAANHSGLLRTGNENYGREVLELMTTGLYKPDGSPVYNDLDVFENSRAFTGMGLIRAPDGQGNFVKVIGFSSYLHAPGPKRLFAGTPQEMIIDTAADFAREIFIKQRDQVAYELARRLWSRFINNRGTTTDYLQLAQVIVQHDFKLWPVLKEMMASEAFYAPESEETILKDPSTFYITFARMSGMPLDSWYTAFDNFWRMGMLIGRPNSVFGFNYQNRALSADFYQLQRHNSLIYHALYQDLDNLERYYGWTPYSGLVQGIPLTGNAAGDVATEILKRLNLTEAWNADQKASLVQFINYYLSDCNSSGDPGCFMLGTRRVKWYRDAPDLGDTEDAFYRIRFAYVLAAKSPAFGTM